MQVIITFQNQYSAIAIPEDAETVYNQYLKAEEGLTLLEYLTTLEQKGEIIFENQETKRKIIIKKM